LQVHDGGKTKRKGKKQKRKEKKEEKKNIEKKKRKEKRTLSSCPERKRSFPAPLQFFFLPHRSA
jgi:hypothetical protein